MATTDENGWAVTVEAAGEPGDVDDDGIDQLVGLLAGFGAAVAAHQDGSRYGATFSVPGTECATIDDVPGYALTVFRGAAEAAGLPALETVLVEIKTYAEQDAELARPVIPELVGIAEIADILAVSKQRAHQLAAKPDFPDPVAELASGRIWTKGSLTRFVEDWHAGKPDVSEEVAMLDITIEELRRRRNALVHGKAEDPTDADAVLRQLTQKIRDALLSEAEVVTTNARASVFVSKTVPGPDVAPKLR